MASTVNINELADVIMQGLIEYSELATDDMKEAVKHASTTVRKEIQANAPKDTGKYAKSWTVKKIRETSRTLTIKATPLSSGLVKAKTGNTTDATVYNDWYKSVYMPTIAEAEEGGVA